jgi:type VI secretion system secreted protein Hcp
MALGDMFLKVESARQGAIKGEARDADHKDEIQIIRWSWGMRAQTALGGAGPTGKTSVHELSIVKRVDCASTALMSAMRSNDLIKKVVLTVRKAGENPLEYLKITLQSARITAFDVESGAFGDEAELIENMSLAFQRISVEYVPQGTDGQPRGSTSFETEIV